MHRDTATLHVRTGRHRGAAVPLGAAPCVVGSDDDADIVLSDAGIAPRHFEVVGHPRGLAVTALESLHVDGAGEVAAGFRAIVPVDARLAAGGVEMALTLPRPDRPRRAIRPGAAGPVLICVAILASANGAGTANEAPVPGSVRLAAAIVDPMEGPRPAAIPRAASPSPAAAIADAAARALPAPTPAEARPGAADLPSPPVADPASIVRAKLREAGLDRLELTAETDALALAGRLPADGAEAWTAFRRWYDAAFPGTLLRTADVEVGADAPEHPPFPRVQSLWHIGRPFAVIDGTRVREGHVLRDGWTVAALEDGRIGLAYEGRTYWLAMAGDGE